MTVWFSQAVNSNRLYCPFGHWTYCGNQFKIPILYFFLFFFILAVLGLRCCARAFSSCGERGHSSSQCAGLSLSQLLLLWSTGSRRTGSVVVAHGPSCSVACGIFPDQGSNPCLLHWQADSQPLCHQGSPKIPILICSGCSSQIGRAHV